MKQRRKEIGLLESCLHQHSLAIYDDHANISHGNFERIISHFMVKKVCRLQTLRWRNSTATTPTPTQPQSEAMNADVWLEAKLCVQNFSALSIQ